MFVIVIILLTIFMPIQANDIFLKKCYEGTINVGETIREQLIPLVSKLLDLMRIVYVQSMKTAIGKEVSKTDHEVLIRGIKCHLGRCVMKSFHHNALGLPLTNVKKYLEIIKIEANCRVIKAYKFGLFSNLIDSKLHEEFFLKNRSNNYNVFNGVKFNLKIILNFKALLLGFDDANFNFIRVLLNGILENLEQSLFSGLKNDLGLLHCELGGKNRIFNYCKDIDEAIDVLIKTIWNSQQYFEDCVHKRSMET